MSVWKGSILLFVCAAVLLLSTITVSAVTITDDTDDVWYYNFPEYEVGTVANKPNIDITSVSYTIIGSEITLTMTVKGIIEDSDLISYVIYFGTVNESGDIFLSPCRPGYQVVYSNEHGYYSYFGLDGFSMEPGDFGELTDPVSGNTFTATFEIAHFDPAVEVLGKVMEADPMFLTDAFSVFWMDVTSNLLSLLPSIDDEDGVDEDEPIDDEDEDTTGDDEDIILPNGDDTDGDGNGGNGGGTPGFEILAFIVALAIAFIILKRKKL